MNTKNTAHFKSLSTKTKKDLLLNFKNKISNRKNKSLLSS